MGKSKLRHCHHLDDIGSEYIFSLIQIGLLKFRTYVLFRRIVDKYIDRAVPVDSQSVTCSYQEAYPRLTSSHVHPLRGNRRCDLSNHLGQEGKTSSLAQRTFWSSQRLPVLRADKQ